MLSFLIKFKNAIFDILFPPICLNCRSALINSGNYICDNCYNSIQINTSLFCPVCRRRWAENKKICFHASYALAAAGNYDDPILKNLIHYFKYEYFENLASVLKKIIIKYVESLDWRSEFKINNFIVIPLPLHPRREKERGFNQSKLLAESVSRHFNLKLLDILKRIKNSKPQAQCENKKRMENVSNCFQLKNSADAEKIKNKNILLIDDVFTSGATANEAIKILKQNHCRKIIVLVLAKA